MVQEFDIVEIKPFEQDKAIVEQLGFIDLRLAYETGVIPADVGAESLQYEEIEHDNVIGRPDDVFQSKRYVESVVAASSAPAPDSNTEGGA